MDEQRRNPCLGLVVWQSSLEEIISGSFGDEREMLAACGKARRWCEVTRSGDLDGGYLGEAKIREPISPCYLHPSMSLLALGACQEVPAHTQLRCLSSLFLQPFFTCKRSLPWAP